MCNCSKPSPSEIMRTREKAALDAFGIPEVAPGVSRWWGVRWYGLPWPLRARWRRERLKRGKDPKLDSCGCIVALRDAYDALGKRLHLPHAE